MDVKSIYLATEAAVGGTDMLRAVGEREEHYRYGMTSKMDIMRFMIRIYMNLRHCRMGWSRGGCSPVSAIILEQDPELFK